MSRNRISRNKAEHQRYAYYDDAHNMHMSLIRAIYRAIGHPLPEPEPTPEPEPPIVDPIEKAEAEYQALVAAFQGYYFIPRAFVAIKRTGMWLTAIIKEQS